MNRKKNILLIVFSFVIPVVLIAQNKKLIENLKQECHSVSLKDFDKSITLAKKGENLSLIEKDSISFAFFERFIGIAYYFKGDYTSASKYYFNSIKILEKQNDKTELGFSYNELAKLYRKTKKLNLAKETYDKALKIFTELNDSTHISMINNESGVVFEYEGNYEEALKRYSKSLIISQNLNDSIAISYALNNIAGLYSLQKDYNAAKLYLNKSLLIRKQLKDSFSIALNYSDLGSNCITEKKFKEAILYIDSSNTIAKNIRYMELQSQNYLILSKIYENLGNSDFAYLNFKKHISLKDSIFTKESENQLNELNTKYQTEKKDLELAKNKVEIESEKNKRYISYIILTLILITLAFVVLAFIQKRKNSKMLEEKNKQLNTANAEITHQKEELHEKQTEILDSIHYAKRIQNALLTSETFLTENLKNHFILFKPKDIVSGDFYWATKYNNAIFFACCDSTGHGVPGAFVSLLNIGFLNEAVKEKGITEPGKIFDYVRMRLIETISDENQKDGFDGILIKIEQGNTKIEYTGANNNPMFIRSGELIHGKTNKMPVGKGIKDESFQTFSIELNENDSIYLFTDGFPDQFGGPKGKKFKYKQLEDLLYQNNSINVDAQLEILEHKLTEWKGNLEQVDDVCVVGIKL